MKRHDFLGRSNPSHPNRRVTSAGSGVRGAGHGTMGTVSVGAFTIRGHFRNPPGPASDQFHSQEI
jgi:hypothetical protein